MKFSKWLTSAFAFAVIMPCALLFAACGGTEIEQGPALTAVNDAVTAAESVTTNYSIKTEISMYIADMGMNVNGTTSQTVSGENDNLKIHLTGNLNSKINMELGGATTTSNSHVTLDTKIAKIDGTFYGLDTKQKIYSELDQFDMEDFATMFGNMNIITITEGMLTVPTEPDEGCTKTVKTTYLKTGDNSYIIKAEITDTTVEQDPVDEEVTYTTVDFSSYEYEIKDGKLTKYAVVQKSTFDNEVQMEIKATYFFTYGETSISTPANLENYEEGTVITNINDVMGM